MNIAEAYSETCQKSKTEHFTKMINGLTMFAKRFILDAWKGSEYAFVLQFLFSTPS